MRAGSVLAGDGEVVLWCLQESLQEATTLAQVNGPIWGNRVRVEGAMEVFAVLPPRLRVPLERKLPQEAASGVESWSLEAKRTDVYIWNLQLGHRTLRPVRRVRRATLKYRERRFEGVDDEHGLPEDVQIHHITYRQSGSHVEPENAEVQDRDDDVPYLSAMSRKEGPSCLVGISKRLPKMGSGRGPGGRGKEERIRRLHSATAVTATRAEKAITR